MTQINEFGLSPEVPPANDVGNNNGNVTSKNMTLQNDTMVRKKYT